MIKENVSENTEAICQHGCLTDEGGRTDDGGKVETFYHVQQGVLFEILKITAQLSTCLSLSL